MTFSSFNVDLLTCQRFGQSGSRYCFLPPDHYTVLMAACASSHDREDHILSCINALIDKGAVVNSFDRFVRLLLYFGRRLLIQDVNFLWHLSSIPPFPISFLFLYFPRLSVFLSFLNSPSFSSLYKYRSPSLSDSQSFYWSHNRCCILLHIFGALFI